MARPLLFAGLTAVSLAAASALMVGTASAAPAATLFTSSTPGSYSATVPAGVTSVTIDAVGGSGGASANNGIPGGEGGIITSTVTVAPGDSLSITVGANGVCGDGNDGALVPGCVGTGGSGAGNGGSSNGSGGGGGGGSAVTDGGITLVVAGGGGGSAQEPGGNADQNGSGLGGFAGTLSGPGNGACIRIGELLCASSGVGMNGGGGRKFDFVGGGGGYLGGGAGLGGGGGGGASYPAPATQWDTTATPSVTITYTPLATSLSAAPQLVEFRPFAGIGSQVVQATLTSGGSPVSGASISFSVGSTPLCTATTGLNGVARCVISPSGQARVNQANSYTATFAGNGDYLASHATTPEVVLF